MSASQVLNAPTLDHFGSKWRFTRS